MMSSPTRWSRMAPGKTGQAPAPPSPAPSPGHPSCRPHTTHGHPGSVHWPGGGCEQQTPAPASGTRPSRGSKPHLGSPPPGHSLHLTAQCQLHARLHIPQLRGQHARCVHQVHQGLLADLGWGESGQLGRMARQLALWNLTWLTSEALSSFIKVLLERAPEQPFEISSACPEVFQK